VNQLFDVELAAGYAGDMVEGCYAANTRSDDVEDNVLKKSGRAWAIFKGVNPVWIRSVGYTSPPTFFLQVLSANGIQ